MRKTKLFTGIVVAGLAISMPLTSMAATWDDVDAWSKLAQVFQEDKDEEVEINLTGDIKCENTLTSGEGQSYTINGGNYTLTDVQIDGSGTVEINSDIDGTTDAGVALAVEGDAKVTLNGDITGVNDGLGTYDNAQVTVKGDITAQSDGIIAEGDSRVDMTGNITTSDNDGIDTDDNAQVTVKGNVTAKDDDGILADGSSTVVVTGDVTGYDVGVAASDTAKVTVNGNVSGMDGKAPDEKGKLDEGTMSDPEGFSDGGLGVETYGEATVTVNGNVAGGDSYGTYSYAGDGVMAYDESKVIVNGNVTGGNQIADPEVKHKKDMEGYGGDGVTMSSTANITVYGDVTGGSASGDGAYAGCGVYIECKAVDEANEAEAGTLYVEGTISGGESLGPDGHAGIALLYDNESFNIDDFDYMYTYDDFDSHYEAMNFVRVGALNDLHYLAYIAINSEDGSKWVYENYWYVIDEMFEAETGKSLWAIDSSAGSEACQKMLDAMDAAGLSMEEQKELISSMIELCNDKKEELIEKAVSKLNETDYYYPEVYLIEAISGEGYDAVEYNNELTKNNSQEIESKIHYIKVEEPNEEEESKPVEMPKDDKEEEKAPASNPTDSPKTGDSPMVMIAAALATFSAFIMMIIKRKLKEQD
ncbi:MAG: hypothetical protein IJX85_00040 [Lachnospiraceae bacterium]|nr:hypothetical protein [Lachnospiraceae bacterium]